MNTKARLTFTLDPEVSHRAKAVARSRGQSLSSMVQTLLANEVGARVATAHTRPFSERWSGRMTLVKKHDERFLRLKHKHGL